MIRLSETRRALSILERGCNELRSLARSEKMPGNFDFAISNKLDAMERQIEIVRTFVDERAAAVGKGPRDFG